MVGNWIVGCADERRRILSRYSFMCRAH